MLKRMLPLLAILAVFTANAQNVQFTGGKSQAYWLSNSGMTDIHVQFTNKSGSTGSFVYKSVFRDWPSKTQWDRSFCDAKNCYTDFVDSDTFLSVGDNQEKELKVTVFPLGHADTGVFSYEFYRADNPTVKDTVTVSVYVPWGAGTKEVTATQFHLYPNPAISEVQFYSPVQGNVAVMDAKGAVVLRTSALAGTNIIQMGSLPAGVYTVQLVAGNSVFNEKLIKQ